MDSFEKILKTGCLICITILICLYIVNCSDEDKHNHSNLEYYEIRFDVYPVGRKDTIHRVFYTKHGKVEVRNYVTSDSGNEFILRSQTSKKTLYREIGNVKIISQKPITKEIYDSK